MKDKVNPPNNISKILSDYYSGCSYSEEMVINHLIHNINACVKQTRKEKIEKMMGNMMRDMLEFAQQEGVSWDNVKSHAEKDTVCYLG